MYKIFGLIIFNNTHDAIKVEKIFSTTNYAGRLISAPEQIVSGCGFSWRFQIEDFDAVIEILQKNQIKFKNIYKLEKNNLKNDYTLII